MVAPAGRVLTGACTRPTHTPTALALANVPPPLQMPTRGVGPKGLATATQRVVCMYTRRSICGGARCWHWPLGGPCGTVWACMQVHRDVCNVCKRCGVLLQWRTLQPDEASLFVLPVLPGLNLRYGKCAKPYAKDLREIKAGAYFKRHSGHVHLPHCNAVARPVIAYNSRNGGRRTFAVAAASCTRAARDVAMVTDRTCSPFNFMGMDID